MYEGMTIVFKAGNKLRNIENLILSNNHITMPKYNAMIQFNLTNLKNLYLSNMLLYFI